MSRSPPLVFPVSQAEHPPVNARGPALRPAPLHRSGALLYASKMIMRPGRVTEEHLDPCLEQTDSQYAARPLPESGPGPENAAPHPRAAVQTCCGDDYASQPVGRRGPCHESAGWRPDHRQAYTLRISAPGTRRARLAHEQGASRRVGLEIVRNHDGNASPLLGTSHGSTHLRGITPRRCVREQPGHRTSHHASRPGQSHRPCDCPQALRGIRCPRRPLRHHTRVRVG